MAPVMRRVVLRPTFLLPRLARVAKPRPMPRATLPVSPLPSRLSPRASLSRATLTPPVTSILVLPPVSLPFLLAPPRRSRRMQCATPPVVPQPMFIPLPRARLPRALMRRVMLPVVRLASRLSRRASLWRATLTAPATHLVVLPPASHLPPLARLQRTHTMSLKLATPLTVSLPQPQSTPVSLPTCQLTGLATSPSVPRTAHPLGLLPPAHTLRSPLTPLAMSGPLVPPRECLPCPRASCRRTSSTSHEACLPRLLVPP